MIAYSLFRSLAHLEAACRTLDVHCVRASRRTASGWGQRRTIHRHRDRAQPLYRLSQRHGGRYGGTRHGRGVYDLVLEKRLMARDQLDRVLQPDRLTRPQALTAI